MNAKKVSLIIATAAIFSFIIIFLWFSGILPDIILIEQTRRYLSKIPNVKVLAVEDMILPDEPQVIAKIEVAKKGRIIFNSVWPPGNFWNKEENSSIAQIGPCRFSKFKFSGYDQTWYTTRRWVTLTEIPELKIRSLNDLVVNFDSVVKAIDQLPEPPISPKEPRTADLYASCKYKNNYYWD